jgi:hypothetical protein
MPKLRPAAPLALSEFAGLLWCEQQAVAVAELGEYPADGVVGSGRGGGVGGPLSCLGPHCRPVDPACVEGMLLDQVEGVGEVPLNHGVGRRGGRRLGPLDAAALAGGAGHQHGAGEQQP